MLERPPGGAVSLMQLSLARAAGATDRVVSSVSRCLEVTNLSTLLPLLELLIARPMLDLNKNALIALYAAAGGNDKLLAFTALMCLSFLPTERDWICRSIRDTLRRVPFTRRSAFVQMLVNRWLAAIEHTEVRPMFWSLIELLLTHFSEVFQPRTFVTIVERIIVVGVVNDFFGVATRVVKARPSTEAATLLIHAAGLARGMAAKDAFDAFNGALQKYIDGADPLLLELYDIVLGTE
jgi:hypothetical protein